MFTGDNSGGDAEEKGGREQHDDVGQIVSSQLCLGQLQHARFPPHWHTLSFLLPESLRI